MLVLILLRFFTNVLSFVLMNMYNSNRNIILQLWFDHSECRTFARRSSVAFRWSPHDWVMFAQCDLWRFALHCCVHCVYCEFVAFYVCAWQCGAVLNLCLVFLFSSNLYIYIYI